MQTDPSLQSYLMILGEEIVVSSVNCRGLQDIKKRTDVLDFLKNNIHSNIFCLQDTHWTDKDEKQIRNIWNNPLIIHGLRTNARGVSILLKNNFEFKIINSFKDTTGNLILIDLLIGNEFSIRLINIYAPNIDTPQFFEYVETLLVNHSNDYTVLCGYFNLVLDQNMDSMNYNKINNPRSKDFVLKMINNNNLIDAFRKCNPDQKRYTWRRRNPIRQARLDYFLVTDTLCDIISKAKIIPGYRTDHSIIQLNLVLNHFKRGRGTWKFNCSLLKSQEYVQLINEAITDEKILPSGV